jgi:hypothetical protein
MAVDGFHTLASYFDDRIVVATIPFPSGYRSRRSRLSERSRRFLGSEIHGEPDAFADTLHRVLRG